MSSLWKFLTFEYKSEHETEYNLSKKKQYSEPKIYDAGGDLSKRWYIYYTFRDPETGKLTRQKNLYGLANKFHTKTQRLEVLVVLRKRLSQFLKDGYNPYEDNPSDVPTKEEKNKTEKKKEKQTGTPIKSAFEKALELKKNSVAETTYVNYKSKMEKFQKWLKKKHPRLKYIEYVTKQHVSGYLNDVLTRTSARTRNNTRVELGSIFQVFVDNDMIPVNFVHSINVLRTRPERHKTYTLAQQKEIFNYLEKEDPIMLVYIQFISYNFLRPIEVCRLKVKDVDVEEKRIYVRAKNKPVKIKIIPDLMLQSIPDLSGMNKENFLFTPEGFGMEWDASDINRRDHFTKRFSYGVKRQFKLGKDYSMYSFRHTFITRLYNEMIKNATPFEVKSRLMLITGHSTMQALEKYLRDIDASLPEDYSDLLTD
jgi:integrase